MIIHAWPPFLDKAIHQGMRSVLDSWGYHMWLQDGHHSLARRGIQIDYTAPEDLKFNVVGRIRILRDRVIVWEHDVTRAEMVCFS